MLSHTITLVTSHLAFWDLSAPAFARAVPALLEVYAAAMSPPADQLTGRRTVMERHSALPGFFSVTAVAEDEADGAVGFAYGFPGRRGQWWHDVVTAAVREHDAASERRWFAASFEIAEVHVHPRWQGRGIGRELLRRLTAERAERTAVLSTHSGTTRARSLYRSYGFVDVLSGFYFPGSVHQPFTIMAAPLPLREHRSPRGAGRAPGWLWTG